MVSSLDGFIAKNDGDIGWMRSIDTYQEGKTLTDEYVAEFLESIDCYVMGARTYEHALELGWPYGDKPVFVLSHSHRTSEKGKVQFYSGNLSVLVKDHLKSNYRNIWMVGGSELTKEFIRHDLADEIVLSIMPVLLGDGTLFFDFLGTEKQLHLLDLVAYKDGMVELTYQIDRNAGT